MAKKLILIGSILFLLVTIPIALFLVKQNQDPRQRAQVTTPTPQQNACEAPNPVPSVLVDYPGCNGNQCDLTTASCEWEEVVGASSYTISVNQVESGEFVKQNESIPSSVTRVTFPIVQNKTYKCTVQAVASCGNLSAAVSDQLLCEADAILTTPTPTPPPAAPTASPSATLTPTIPVQTPTPTLSPTPTPLPVYLPTATPTPTPTIKQPGGFIETIGIFGAVVIIVIGGVLLLVL